MLGGTGSARRTWAAVMAGLVWAQVSIALRVLVLPGYLTLGDGIAESWGYRLAYWTLLAPLALATPLTGGTATSGVRAVGTGYSPATLMLCSLAGVGLCWSAQWALGKPRWRRVAVAFCAGAGLLGLVCAGTVWASCREAITAESAYFAMVSRVNVAHRDPGTVAAARTFVRQYPNSRWAGEALRIVAMAEWDAGHFRQASHLWARFGQRFRDRNAPGVAYAEYSMALCEQRLGRTSAAQQHLRAAIGVIRARGDGIQGWIATNAAEQLSACERSEGRYALAGYWKTKSGTFSDVYATE